MRICALVAATSFIGTSCFFNTPLMAKEVNTVAEWQECMADVETTSCQLIRNSKNSSRSGDRRRTNASIPPQLTVASKDELHQKCKDARDYQGCINSYAISKVDKNDVGLTADESKNQTAELNYFKPDYSKDNLPQHQPLPGTDPRRGCPPGQQMYRYNGLFGIGARDIGCMTAYEAERLKMQRQGAVLRNMQQNQDRIDRQYERNMDSIDESMERFRNSNRTYRCDTDPSLLGGSTTSCRESPF